MKTAKKKSKGKPSSPGLDISKIKADVEKKIKAGKIKEKDGEFLKQS